MSSLADKIEQYLKILIERSDTGSIEIQRLELAETFACAPSQITYVISTRFTPKYGFWVESKRGGCGYVRVSRLQAPGFQSADGENAEIVLRQLLETGQLTAREYILLTAVFVAIGDSTDVNTDEIIRDRVMQAVLHLL